MFKIYCVTHRSLCQGAFLPRVAEIADAGVDGIILREKDLAPAEYAALAVQVRDICRARGVPFVFHTFVKEAVGLGGGAIHLPLPVLRGMTPGQKAAFSAIGASCHSLTDAVEAEALGATCVTFGHVFPTDCKKGAPPRGLRQLEQVCRGVNLPVLAIGGIGAETAAMAAEAGAAGVCLMSGFMAGGDPAETVKKLRKGGEGHGLFSK